MMDATPRAIRDALRQTAVVTAALLLCPLAALVSTRDPRIPLARARELMDFERSLGLFVEPGLHAWLQRHDWLLSLAGGFYVWAHVSALVGILTFTWFASTTRFRRLRDAFVCTQLVVVAGYLALPTAPPRLVPEAGFRDTFTQLWGADATALAHTVQSPYAAMPSGHVAFSVIVAAGLWMTSRRASVRFAALAYPALVLLVVMATANHFWLDAVAGALAAGLGLAAANAVGAATRALRAPGGEPATRRREPAARLAVAPAHASQPGTG
jgi:hypothetical protein